MEQEQNTPIDVAAAEANYMLARRTLRLAQTIAEAHKAQWERSCRDVAVAEQELDKANKALADTHREAMKAELARQAAPAQSAEQPKVAEPATVEPAHPDEIKSEVSAGSVSVKLTSPAEFPSIQS